MIARPGNHPKANSLVAGQEAVRFHAPDDLRRALAGRRRQRADAERAVEMFHDLHTRPTRPRSIPGEQLAGVAWTERGRFLNEGIRVLRHLWSQEGPISFSGRYTNFREMLFEPKPARRGGPPI